MSRGVTKCVNECAHGLLLSTNVPSRVYYMMYLQASVPGDKLHIFTVARLHESLKTNVL